MKKKICRRIMAYICAVLVIIPILCLPANAENYGVICSDEERSIYENGSYKCFLCDEIYSYCYLDDEFSYDTVIQDSYYVPEDDIEVIRLQEALDRYCEYSEGRDERIIDAEASIYFRTFRGDVLDGFYTAGTSTIFGSVPNTIHRILSMCDQVYYSNSWKTVFRTYSKDGSSQIGEETNIDYNRVWINPINDKISNDGTSDAVEAFLKNPEGMLTSAEITKPFADGIEIIYTFAFIDESANLVYCVTNYGDYVYFVSDFNYSVKNPQFIFPADTFKSMLREMAWKYANTYKKGYHADDVWEIVRSQLQSINCTKKLLNYYTKEEILPYVVGGEEALAAIGIESTEYGKALIVKNTKSPQVDDSNIPADNEETKEEDQITNNIFAVLFITETALVVVALSAFVVILALRERTKRKKEES